MEISGKEVMLKNKSYFKESTGDEAGAAAKKGVITSTNRGKVYFIAWSSDVKFEGENAVRHLDMTTHNHASPMANEAAPTVYIDEMEVAFPKSCAKLVAQQNTHCSGAKQLYNDNGEPAGMDCNKACKAARDCLFPPYDKSKQFCCAPETTGHHVIPKAEFLQVGGGAALNTAVSGYKPDKAPCVCAEGYSWHTRDNALSLRPLKTHGRLHAAYNKERARRGLSVGDNAPYQKLRDSGVAAVHKERPSCKSPKDCTADQLDQFHVTESKIPPAKPVCRVSDQRESELTRPEGN